METQQEQQAVSVLAQARLTEPQVQTAIVEYLLKDEGLKDVIFDKKVTCIVKWQTTKWNDPDALAHVFFMEDPLTTPDILKASVSDESNEDNGLQVAGPDTEIPAASPVDKAEK